MELLVDNLKRLNEAEETDRQGLFHVLGEHKVHNNQLPCQSSKLGIFENLVGLNPSLGATLATKTDIIPWLLKRVQAKKHDENRGYAAELLSILLQNSRDNKILFGKSDGVETLLKVLSVREYGLLRLCLMLCRISGGGTPSTQKKLNLWRTFSMPSAPHSVNLQSKNYFLKQRDRI